MAYNDPPYTFMGPDADKVLKGIFTTTPLPVVPEPAVDAGLSSPVTKTAKGYPNIGLSTTPPPDRR